ncbi:hypothetical protein [Aneurinibacillus danicus]|uniref:Glycosyl transferase n=1 Tax=Aneurinibacillus danicus TaxID=267746 RepID=A0A511V5Q1_9BACL|nr:hypothetical protein [Aneurinibacillus danicus]GEN33441.1 glycosyl transferase [Aneurinibacillus danicus]
MSGLIFAVGWLMGYIGMRLACAIFIRMKWVASNYAGHAIPLGYGLILSFGLLGFATLSVWRMQGFLLSWVVCAAVVVSLAGWLDDRYGQTRAKGLRGHFNVLWREGKVTTGIVKLGIIGICAVAVAASASATAVSFMVDALLLGLSANFVNLLDVRPGRALKGFWFILIICAIFGTLSPALVPLFWYMLGCTLAAAPFDCSAQAMLGDTGANLLGFVGGIFCVYSFDASVKWLLIGTLFLIQLYAERVSLTAVIERSPVLSRIDQWGRPPEAR